MSSTDNVFLSVVIPAYNEQARIGKTLALADMYLKGQPYASEILVVDDGSDDRTAAVVRDYAKRIKNLTLIQQERNYGKGWAVRTGMLAARGRYRLFMDADSSTTINHWEVMEPMLDQYADVVIGSRHIAGSEIWVHQGQHREVLGALFRVVVRMLFGLKIVDTQNGFKAFTADAAEKIFAKQTVRGWAFDVEILKIARELNYKAIEVPVIWINDAGTKLSLFTTPLMVLDLLRIRLANNGTPNIPDARPASKTAQWAHANRM